MSNTNIKKVRTSDLELKDRLVSIQRVTKVTKGGRTFSFSAIVVVGNEDGVVGYGLGKASEVQSAIAKGVEDAKKNGGGDFPTIPAGKYEVKLESMEIKGTKADPNRPMLAVSFKILSGEFKNQRLFMNRVLYGTKNDKNMIASAMGFLEKLDSGVPVSFTSYKQFSQLVFDVAEAIDGNLEYAVDYDDSRFNSITVEEVFEVEN